MSVRKHEDKKLPTMQEDFQEGQRQFQQAIQAYKSGNHTESNALFENLLKTNSDNPLIYRTMGAIRIENGKFDEALPYLKEALALDPFCPFTNHDYAVCLMNMGLDEEADKHIDQAIKKEPVVSIFWSSKAAIDFKLNRIESAVLNCKKALALNCNNQGALTTLINALVALGRYDEAAAAVRKGVVLKSANANMQAPEIFCLPSKLIHDYEQIDYLLKNNKIGIEYELLRDNLKEVVDRLPQEAIDKNMSQKLRLMDALKVAPTVANYVHVPELKKLNHLALNEALDFEQLQNDYLTSDPHLIVVDNFLSKAALEGIRNYCMEATIWHKMYQNGYLGAMLMNGFGTELLFQISADIKACFPKIFKDFHLMQSWCFKCAHERPAINLHADFAEVNLNLWITPEDANLDKTSGGLVVYDKASPKNWKFADYNSNQFKIKDFIEKSEAKEIVIPYKENRIVIFDSALFHKSDDFKFKPGYENRRMNVTFLYGQQLKS